jgi:hypothetical protein
VVEPGNQGLTLGAQFGLRFTTPPIDHHSFPPPRRLPPAAEPPTPRTALVAASPPADKVSWFLPACSSVTNAGASAPRAPAAGSRQSFAEHDLAAARPEALDLVRSVRGVCSVPPHLHTHTEPARIGEITVAIRPEKDRYEENYLGYRIRERDGIFIAVPLEWAHGRGETIVSTDLSTLRDEIRRWWYYVGPS